MGQTITQQTTINELEPETFLLKYFQLYQLHKTLSNFNHNYTSSSLDNGLLVKTVIATNEEDNPLVIKIFPKTFLNDKTKEFYAKQVQSLQELGTLITPLRCFNIPQILQIYDLPVSNNIT